ncbi:hypothetical protein [Rhodopseudomonas sp. WA056]|uniref:hypothetical protein n=1 Tax=Rhodopseudomonas sp. WA056 TaxID=2269367 RepID=UPI0013DF7300|nr:hypothetical protein [Rhodopseudomonas sp. WA056]
MNSVFEAVRLQREIAHIEFRYFRKRALAEAYKVACTVDRFECLEREFSFRVVSKEEDHIQIGFGKRKMGIRDFDGMAAVETGPSLVYTLSRTSGVFSATLFPATSKLGGVKEDHIFLRIGSYGGPQMSSWLRSDIGDLVSYAFVSSLETSPSVLDRFRFWWLRSTRPLSSEGKFTAKLSPKELFTSSSAFMLKSVAVSLARQIVNLAAYSALIYLGWSQIAQQFR